MHPRIAASTTLAARKQQSQTTLATNVRSRKLQRTGRWLCAALASAVVGAYAQVPDVNEIPAYKKEYDIKGGLRIAGSELKGNVDALVEGFKNATSWPYFPLPAKYLREQLKKLD